MRLDSCNSLLNTDSLQRRVMVFLTPRFNYDVTAVSHVLAMSHVAAIGNDKWQSQMTWRSIYSLRSSRRESSCFYPTRHYFRSIE